MRARPAEVCRELLAALTASEGRRARRKRDTTPDAIGLAMKRELLERAVVADPEPEEFEGWLCRECDAVGAGGGGLRAIALVVFEEWRLAEEAKEFREWLACGAPSEDAAAGRGEGRSGGAE